MAEKSKILIIGGTGYIGKFIVEASAKSGHPTFALARESTISDPVKGKIFEGFKNYGVTILIVCICKKICSQIYSSLFCVSVGYEFNFVWMMILGFVV